MVYYTEDNKYILLLLLLPDISEVFVLVTTPCPLCTNIDFWYP